MNIEGQMLCSRVAVSDVYQGMVKYVEPNDIGLLSQHPSGCMIIHGLERC